MATVSELSIDQLKLYREKYLKKLSETPGDLDAQKKLNAIETEILKREKETLDPTKTYTATQGAEEARGGIVKYHTSDEDTSTFQNATFGNRAVAAIVDGVILAVTNQILTVVIGIILPPTILAIAAFVLSLALQYGYFIVMTLKGGQTLGKKLMKIRVVPIDSGELGLGAVILRETIGKFVSGIVLALGYIWVLIGKEAWHDSMANTRVVKLD